MVASILTAVAGASGLGLLWWLLAAHLRTPPDSRPVDRPREVTPGHPDAAVPPERAAAFADPAQSWHAVDIANDLLDALLAGRIARAEYRERILRLACHCESGSGDQR